MTAISYHDTAKDLQDLDWSCAGPFARPEWFALLENGGPAPVFATVRSGPQAVCLPLSRTGRTLQALTNWYAFTWRVLHTGDAPDDALLEALASDLARHASRVTLTKVPEEDGSSERLQTAFGQAGWRVVAQPCDVNHVLDLKGRSFAQYLAGRPGPLRTTIRRKAGKVAVALSACFDPQDWAAYEAIYAASWKPEEGDPALLRAFAEGESAGGRYRFALARLDGEPVAAQFWTVDGDRAYIHKLAHRPEAEKLSPGTALTAALFERVIDTDGVDHVDFGTGDDAYKRDWMESVRTRWRLDCLRPADPRNWPVLAKAAARKLVSPRKRV